ncbi:Lathosterol oxidase [Rhizophlyctis rosea]|uniref:Lathosterol oxidase n=1 Tax=Rhizophlyctis rosea TaxID=64517 RepID=A0AAD5X337_9FUNG|nr:Lathosterol oxidase [Rhizophlyctis rosea]
MDIVLNASDNAFFDAAYSHLPTLLQPFYSSRDHIVRQYTSLYIISLIGAEILYLTVSTLAYYLVFDHDLKKHPKYLPNQIKREIWLSVTSLVWTAVVTAPWFLAEVRGWSRLYYKVEDGYFQSLPYHIFVFLFPMHCWLYLAAFIFVQCWTISIHDGAYFTSHPWINGSAHHTIHHLEFNYNYGQYFTLWDRIGGSYRQPVAQFENEMFFEREEKREQRREAWGIGGKGVNTVKAKGAEGGKKKGGAKANGKVAKAE